MNIFSFLKKKIVEKFFSFFGAKLKYQSCFERLHVFVLSGQNMGGGTIFSSSGEAYALNYIYKKLKAQLSVIFDVGANVGSYALLANRIFSKNGLILSFEPSPSTYRQLEDTVKEIKEIQTYNLGFSDVNASSTIYSDKKMSGLASLYKRDLEHFEIEMNISEPVELLTIDAFCAANKIAHIDFLKLDVEGHEFFVLQGAFEMLKQKKVQFIQFEFGGCNIDSRTFFRDFFRLLNPNYQLYRLLKDGLYPIKKYHERYEVFSTTNFLAELRP